MISLLLNRRGQTAVGELRGGGVGKRAIKRLRRRRSDELGCLTAMRRTEGLGDLGGSGQRVQAELEK